MSKCTTGTCIDLITDIDVMSLAPTDRVGFSQHLEPTIAQNCITNAGNIGLGGETDLAVVIDNLIHGLADGTVSI